MDGLLEAGFPVRLVNPAKVKQYDGIQHTNDFTDATYLAHLLRILPKGHIYPKAQRAVRDLLRKRDHLVRAWTRTITSIQNIPWRNTGERFGSDAIKQLAWEAVEQFRPDLHQELVVRASLSVLARLQQQIGRTTTDY